MSLLVVGIGGSLTRPSTSLQSLELALRSAADAGAEVELLDVRKLRLPLYDETIEPPPEARRLAELAGRAQAMVWSSPTYHGSASGALKNTLDWLQLLDGADPPFLTDKPIGLISTAAGWRGVQAIDAMVHTAHALRAWAVPFSVSIAGSHRAFSPEGGLLDTEVGRRLATLGRMIAAAARRFSASPELLDPSFHDPHPVRLAQERAFESVAIRPGFRSPDGR